MEVDPIIKWAERLVVREQAVEWLEKNVKGRDGFEDLRVLKMLKVKEDREVFLVEIAGKKAVVKRFINPDSAAIVMRLKAELDYLCQSMADGPHQVNKCVSVLPDLGLALLSYVPGEQVGVVLNRVEREERSTILCHAGEWLACYTAGRRRASTFGPRHWIKKARGRDVGALTQADRALVGEVIAGMREQAKGLGGMPVIQAAAHGDFLPRNLHYHEGVIYGVDIQGESWIAVARDAVRFLIWVGMTCEPEPDRPMIYGMVAEDFEAFNASGLLDPSEVHSILPFLMGEQMTAHFIDNYEHPEYAPRLRQTMRRYLDGF